MRGFAKLNIILLNIFCIGGFLFANNQKNMPFEYISPRHDAVMVSPESNIILRPGMMLERSTISATKIVVEGSESGIHRGELILLKDEKTLIFRPSRFFSPGETVTIKLGSGIRTQAGEILNEFQSRFSVSKGMISKVNTLNDHCFASTSQENQIAFRSNKMNGQSPVTTFGADSLPDNFPTFSQTAYDNPTPGYLLMTPFFFAPPDIGPGYLIIGDDYGSPIFYRACEGLCNDLLLQSNGLLSYYEWTAPGITAEDNRYYLMDDRYAVVDSFRTGNGYVTDGHELLILENGNALMMSYDFQTIRMDTIVAGGNPNAVVTGLIIQELDVDKNVIFQWRSWDHFEITDADSNIDLTAANVDYSHGNAIEVDHDGHLLISSRNMSEITKINRQTGDIIWRWGGKKNQFTFINDDRGFAYQHHIRVLPNGNYTLFDNGNFLNPPYSRALEYEIDEQTLTATLVWKYASSTFYPFMGNATRQDDGRTLIGWGGGWPSITEVNPDGTKSLELSYDSTHMSYRAARAKWSSSLLSADADTLWLDGFAGYPDTTTLHLENNTNEAITITTASTRSPFFAVAKALPFDIPANGEFALPVVFFPDSVNDWRDVLTIRADSPTEGFGLQVALIATDLVGIGSDDEHAAGSFYLAQNYPNPFNPETNIGFRISDVGIVQLKIYDISGRLLKTLVNESMNAGDYTSVWDGKNRFGQEVSSGIYFYQLSVKASGKKKQITKVRKMVLLR